MKIKCILCQEEAMIFFLKKPSSSILMPVLCTCKTHSISNVITEITKEEIKGYTEITKEEYLAYEVLTR